MGLPGSGKTFFATALTKEMQALHMNTDSIRKEIFPKPMYSPKEKVAVYETLFDRVCSGLLQGENVIIDATFSKELYRKPYSDFAANIFSLCEGGKINGFVTPVIFSNAYYLLRRTAGHKKVIEKLSQLLSITDVLLMDRNTIKQALTSGFKDFEDALQNFAAVSNGTIDVIVTRNVKDYKFSDIAIFTPEDYLKTFTG